MFWLPGPSRYHPPQATMDVFFEMGGEHLYSLNRDIPLALQPGHSTNDAAWYTPAREVFEDMCIAAAIFPVLVVVAARMRWRVAIPRQPAVDDVGLGDVVRAATQGVTAAVAHSGRGGRLTRWQWLLAGADYAQRAALVVGYCATVAYKLAIPGRLPYLLMPCHLHTKTLLYLSFTGAASRVNNKVHFVSLCLNWGTWLALASPDTRSLTLPLERVHFWASHALLLSLPVTWLLRRRYHIYGGLPGMATTWAVFCLIAIFPVQYISILLARNITYMMIPPKPMMAFLGPSYRRIFGLACVPFLVLFARYVFAEAFLVLGRTRAAAAADVAAGLVTYDDATVDHAAAAAAAAAAATDSEPPSSRFRPRRAKAD